MHPLWVSFGVALALSVVLTPVAGLFARRLGIVDKPDGIRKLQKAPVPLLGGAAVYLAVVGALLAVRQMATADPLSLQRLSNVVMAAAGFVALVGAFDDSRNLKARFKLLLQFAAVLPVALAGYTVDRIVAFGYPIELGWLGVPITACWLVGCINALNLLDGMDGLASTVGITAAAVMAIIGVHQGHAHVATIAIALAGALAGFLVYNLPPARIYLGDCGSMVIGLVVGMLAIQGSLKSAATLSLITPVVVMSIPMLDILLAIVRRRLSGQRIAVADRGHIHHRLLQRGLSTWQALSVMAALCLATGAAATIGTLVRSELVTLLVTLVALAIMVQFRAVAEHEIRLVRQRIGAGLIWMGARLLTARPGKKPQFSLNDVQADWRQLIHAVQHSPVTEMEFVLRSGGQVIAEEAWRTPAAFLSLPAAKREVLTTAEAPAVAAADAWELVTRFGDSQALCQLTIRCTRGQIRPWRLVRLHAILAAYGARFAAYAEASLPTTIPLPSPADQQTKPSTPSRKAA